jgi:hypothetical protein
MQLLKDMFAMFCVVYGDHWRKRFTDDLMVKGFYTLWHDALKDYPMALIQAVCAKVYKQNTFPPSLAEFLEILRADYKQWLLDEQSKQRRIEESLSPEQLERNKAKIADIKQKLMRKLHVNR